MIISNFKNDKLIYIHITVGCRNLYSHKNLCIHLNENIYIVILTFAFHDIIITIFTGITTITYLMAFYTSDVPDVSTISYSNALRETFKKNLL